MWGVMYVHIYFFVYQVCSKLCFLCLIGPFQTNFYFFFGKMFFSFSSIFIQNAFYTICSFHTKMSCCCPKHDFSLLSSLKVDWDLRIFIYLFIFLLSREVNKTDFFYFFYPLQAIGREKLGSTNHMSSKSQCSIM